MNMIRAHRYHQRFENRGRCVCVGNGGGGGGGPKLMRCIEKLPVCGERDKIRLEHTFRD